MKRTTRKKTRTKKGAKASQGKYVMTVTRSESKVLVNRLKKLKKTLIDADKAFNSVIDLFA